jgi:uncharacterized membrane protein
VIAVIITITVLEMKVPHGDAFESLKQVTPLHLLRLSWLSGCAWCQPTP